MCAMIASKVEIHLGLPGGKAVRDHSNEEIATGMDMELGRFEEWFKSKGNESLVPIERSILKTFLAWKLLYEEGDVDPQD